MTTSTKPTMTTSRDPTITMTQSSYFKMTGKKAATVDNEDVVIANTF